MITNGTDTFLLAANFNSGAIEAYDRNFLRATLTGSFTDPTLPAGFAPFGIHVVNNQLVVTYAQQDQAKHDPIHAAGAGYVSLFTQDGVFVRRIASQGNLNAPWGVVLAPAGFGALGGDLLIGNFGDGVINAYNFSSGAFVDQLKDANGAVVTNASLWDLVFDSTGQTGDPNTMYITAGLANEQHGLFAAITANAVAPPPAADFSISASPATLTIAAGQTASYTVTVGGMNGFNSAVTFSCSGQPVGTSCVFSPATATPQSGGTAQTTVNIATSSNPYHPAVIPVRPRFRGRSTPVGLALIFAALLILAVTARQYSRSSAEIRRTLAKVAGFACLLLLLGTVGLSGCGGGGSNANNLPSGTPRGSTTIMLTGTSGSVSHAVSVQLSVQ
jgi:hypothetical protein